jgi:hypothetical protein
MGNPLACQTVCERNRADLASVGETGVRFIGRFFCMAHEEHSIRFWRDLAARGQGRERQDGKGAASKF